MSFDTRLFAKLALVAQSAEVFLSGAIWILGAFISRGLALLNV
jgi:hypothetical protein